MFDAKLHLGWPFLLLSQESMMMLYFAQSYWQHFKGNCRARSIPCATTGDDNVTNQDLSICHPVSLSCLVTLCARLDLHVNHFCTSARCFLSGNHKPALMSTKPFELLRKAWRGALLAIDLHSTGHRLLTAVQEVHFISDQRDWKFQSWDQPAARRT